MKARLRFYRSRRKVRGGDIEKIFENEATMESFALAKAKELRADRITAYEIPVQLRPDQKVGKPKRIWTKDLPK